ncbi:hypothetical protein OEZ86_005546 [Tetradesmus obliquus]|nr:hypothetical protein OEZ86_005546 [Tetradesmus obliquus]
MGAGGAQGPKVELVGYANFVRNNPRSDKFPVHKFHHIEFWCADATNTFKRFQHGLGMTLVAKSDHSTGNSKYCSYVLQSNDLVFTFTAPYSRKCAAAAPSSSEPLPDYDQQQAFEFICTHGLAARAVGLQVGDAAQAYEVSVANGAKGVRPPTKLEDGGGCAVVSEVLLYGDVVLRYISGKWQRQVAGASEPTTAHEEGTAPAVLAVTFVLVSAVVSEVLLYGDVVLRYISGKWQRCGQEVLLYGDVVLRYISGKWQGPYLPGYTATPDEPQICYGLHRLDHAVGNVPKLIEHLEHVIGFTGFHEFAEFVAEDVGTVDSGLNSMVLASNNEMVLLPMNEPTFGTKRKSQIQTYLEQNEGPGLQHLALKTHDILSTMREMHARSRCGGFEFQAAPGHDYYKRVADEVGDVLSPEEWAAVEQLGILVDQDDQGVLLQIFTKPLGDRPTIFIEIIERRGCLKESAAQAGSAAAAAAEPTAAGGDADADGAAAAVADKFKDIVQVREDGVVVEQAAGCGGFGKGNFSELFKSIEEYERTLQV